MGRTSDAKERLIDSGTELMHERGYTAVGVSEVCAQAGVNKGSFYYFFPSKQDLALEVIDNFFSRVRGRLDAMVNGKEPPMERFRNFFRENYLWHAKVKDESGKMLGCPLGNLALEMSTQDPQLRRGLKSTFERFVQSFEEVLRQATESGDLPEQDIGKAARSVVALLEGTILLAKIGDDPGVLEGLEEQALKIVGFSEQS